MVERAREIMQIMGYESVDAVLKAIAEGEVILLKIPDERRVRLAEWLYERVPEIRDWDPELADALDDLADGVELAHELVRYPVDIDVCDLDLPHGWPSYCDRRRVP